MDDVRMFLMDRALDDNPIDLVEEFFTDEDIAAACQRCVSKFNEMPPYNMRITNPNQVPYRSYLIAGICWQVLLAKINQLARRDLDYDAGGMSVDLIGKRIKHFTTLAATCRQEFMDGAQAEKVARNYANAFCQVG